MIAGHTSATHGPIGNELWNGELPGSEHPRGEDEHQRGEENQHGRLLQPCSDHFSAQRGNHAERRIRDDDAENVEDSKREATRAAAVALHSEETHRDRNHRKNARRQIERQTGEKKDAEGEEQSARGKGAGDRVVGESAFPRSRSTTS